MAVNIKDLYGNSGNKLKKIKYSLEFSTKNALPYLFGVFFSFHATRSKLKLIEVGGEVDKKENKKS